MKSAPPGPWPVGWWWPLALWLVPVFPYIFMWISGYLDTWQKPIRRAPGAFLAGTVFFSEHLPSNRGIPGRVLFLRITRPCIFGPHLGDIYLTIYLYIYLSIYLSADRSIYLSICRSIDLSTYLHIYTYMQTDTIIKSTHYVWRATSHITTH